MAYTTINDPSQYFHTRLYTGSGSSGLQVRNNANSGDFTPDWLWIKPRSVADNNTVFDSSRGFTQQLKTNGNDAEDTHSPQRITRETNGFDVDTTDQNYNKSSDTYVAWQWIANGGTTSSNSDGSITSTVQANTTAGFSIITYTGTGSNATIGHGLGATPEFVIVKCRSEAQNWEILHTSLGGVANQDISLNETTGTGSPNGSVRWNALPTSSVINLAGGNTTNKSSQTFVAYAFVGIKGYSRFGQYKGNGNNNGSFVYTGFKPAWVMIKNITDNGDDWHILDSTRSPLNVADERLKANTNDAEGDDDALDFLSNGFKLRNTSNARNSGDTFIYMAFAEHPLVTGTGTPNTAS